MPSCELCQYQYLRHKKFVISDWNYPECSLKDKIRHVFFVVCVLIMIACAAVTIICFKEVSTVEDQFYQDRFCQNIQFYQVCANDQKITT